MADTKDQQMEVFERLQLALLQDFETHLKDNTLSATDRATLVRLLEHNGWTLDAKRLPQGLKDRITKRVDPKSFDDGDADVVIGKIG